MTSEFDKYNPPEEFRALLHKCLPYLTPRKLLKVKNETHVKFGECNYNAPRHCHTSNKLAGFHLTIIPSFQCSTHYNAHIQTL